MVLSSENLDRVIASSPCHGRTPEAPCSSSKGLRRSGVTSGRLVEAGLEPDLNLVLSDIDAKLQLFETAQNRAQDLYDYLEDTK